MMLTFCSMPHNLAQLVHLADLAKLSHPVDRAHLAQLAHLANFTKLVHLKILHIASELHFPAQIINWRIIYCTVQVCVCEA